MKCRQASNSCKRFLEAAKLAYANKIKGVITFQKHGSCEFEHIANSVLNKGKSSLTPLVKKTEVLYSDFDKAK